MHYTYPCPRTENEVRELLVAPCSREWQKSSLIVANAIMLHQERYHEAIGDLVLEERLRGLGAAGAVEIDDASLPYGQYKVRLPATAA